MVHVKTGGPALNQINFIFNFLCLIKVHYCEDKFNFTFLETKACESERTISKFSQSLQLMFHTQSINNGLTVWSVSKLTFDELNLEMYNMGWSQGAGVGYLDIKNI